MQAIDTERSPGLPSSMVTTRRRLMPHGTSFSFLQAVTHALHSMQRSASHRNFIRAMVPPPWIRSLVAFSCGKPARLAGAPAQRVSSFLENALCCRDLAQRGLWFLHSGHRVEPVRGQHVHALA